MEATLLPSSPKSSFLLNNSNKNKINLFRNRFFFYPTGRPFRLRAIDGDSGSNDATQSPSTPEAVEIRFRRGSRKRAKQQVQDMGDASSASSRGVPSPPKDWDSMTLGEKAVELYMGEKGLLFWINKFAYASIFIIIGGWILFRFVGPSLGLYQLDSAPLPPSAVFKQS